MRVLKRHQTIIVFWVAILAFVGNILFVWNSEAMRNSVMGNDEYFFYRVTMNLPHLETDGMWLTEEVAPNPMGVDEYAKGLFERAYTTPIWVHPLVANVIAYPVVMLFSDVAGQIQWLRLFDVAMIIATVILFLDIIKRKTNGAIAGVCILPMMVGKYLLANGIMFYHDLFMWLFFALTMWMITRKPHSKWIVVLASLTVLMKLNAVLLLIPMLLYLWYQTRDRHKVLRVVIVPTLALAVYLAFQAVVAGDALYLLHHWSKLGYATTNFRRHVLPYLWDYVFAWGLWVSIPLIIGGIVMAIVKKVKAFYGFASFAFVTLLYSFGWGFYSYQVFPMMYSAMFMLPLVGCVQQIEGVRREVA